MRIMCQSIRRRKKEKIIYIEISKQKFNTETNPERQLREKRERKKNTEIRTKWKLTSFLNAMNYDTMCSVLWLYLHDPFEVFPMLNNLRVMVFHLNFLHPTKPFGERNKIIIQKTVNDLANYCCAPFCMFMWHTKRIIKMKRFLKFLETEKKIVFVRKSHLFGTYNFLSLGIPCSAPNLISPNGLPRNSNIIKFFGSSSFCMVFIRFPDKNL